MGIGNLFGGGGAEKAAKKAAKLEMQISKEQWDLYKDIYAPLERDLVLETQNFDTAENFERAASDASATVSQQFGKMYDRLGRVPGLDPSSPAYHAALAGLNLGQGLADVAAQNAARNDIRDTAYARKAGSVAVGRGIPGVSISGLGDASRNLLNVSNSQFNKGLATFGAIKDTAKDLASGIGQIQGRK